MRGMKPGLRARKTVAVVALSIGLVPFATAADVWLDWSGFESQIAQAWSSAGYGAGDALTGAEYLMFKSEVKSRMASQFSGYSINLVETAPGGLYERIIFGATTTSSGLLGRAERLDWRNRFKDDIARLYLKNFGFIINAGTYTRAENLDRLTNGITGTASHELGHNTGLQHFDAYGQDNIRAPGYGGITGQQNDSVMATGSTGLTGFRRGLPRWLNPFSKLKLEYADDIAPTLGTTISEDAGSKNTFGSAQFIWGDTLPITGKTAVNIEGIIGSASEIDFYKFTSRTGELISANIFSDLFPVPDTDTIIRLYNAGGTVLVTNDDISYNRNSFMTGSGRYSSDSLILNYEATYTGTYYLSVFGKDPGSYDFLVSGLDPVPEPASIIALGLGAAALLRRRKRTKSSAA